MNISYAVVAAFERSKDPRKARSTSHLFTVLLLAVFFVALMGGLVAGVSVYRSVAGAQMQGNEIRMESGLLANIVRANDAAGAVSEGIGPEGRSLVLSETLESGTYEMRIYLYRGQVVQEYSIAGTEYTPGRAQALARSSSFDFACDDGLLTVRTDLGSFDIALRSEQESGAA